MSGIPTFLRNYMIWEYEMRHGILHTCFSYPPGTTAQQGMTGSIKLITLFLYVRKYTSDFTGFEGEFQMGL